MNGTFVADLFSGCGGVSKAVRVLGFDGREWEIALGPDGDLCNRNVRRKLLHAIRSGRVIAIMAAPPCGTFSSARDRSGAIRSRSFPWGLPDLPPHDAAKVADGNRCLRGLLSVIRCAHTRGLPWLWENPHSSKMWYVPEVAKLSAHDRVETCVLDQCMFGARWKKRTRFLAGNFNADDLCRLNCLCQGGKVCERTGQPHIVLSGSAPGGTPWTRIAQSYPPRLYRVCARLLTEGARMQYVNESFRFAM